MVVVILIRNIKPHVSQESPHVRLIIRDINIKSPSGACTIMLETWKQPDITKAAQVNIITEAKLSQLPLNIVLRVCHPCCMVDTPELVHVSGDAICVDEVSWRLADDDSMSDGLFCAGGMK